MNGCSSPPIWYSRFWFIPISSHFQWILLLWWRSTWSILFVAWLWRYESLNAELWGYIIWRSTFLARWPTANWTCWLSLIMSEHMLIHYTYTFWPDKTVDGVLEYFGRCSAIWLSSAWLVRYATRIEFWGTFQCLAKMLNSNRQCNLCSLIVIVWFLKMIVSFCVPWKVKNTTFFRVLFLMCWKWYFNDICDILT